MSPRACGGRQAGTGTGPGAGAGVDSDLDPAQREVSPRSLAAGVPGADARALQLAAAGAVAELARRLADARSRVALPVGAPGRAVVGSTAGVWRLREDAVGRAVRADSAAGDEGEAAGVRAVRSRHAPGHALRRRRAHGHAHEAVAARGLAAGAVGAESEAGEVLGAVRAGARRVRESDVGAGGPRVVGVVAVAALLERQVAIAGRAAAALDDAGAGGGDAAGRADGRAAAP